jgi:hypothetical protein
MYTHRVSFVPGSDYSIYNDIEHVLFDISWHVDKSGADEVVAIECYLEKYVDNSKNSACSERELKMFGLLGPWSPTHNKRSSGIHVNLERHSRVNPETMMNELFTSHAVIDVTWTASQLETLMSHFKETCSMFAGAIQNEVGINGYTYIKKILTFLDQYGGGVMGYFDVPLFVKNVNLLQQQQQTITDVSSS